MGIILLMMSTSPAQRRAAGRPTEQCVAVERMQNWVTRTLIPGLTLTGPVTLYNSLVLSQRHP